MGGFLSFVSSQDRVHDIGANDAEKWRRFNMAPKESADERSATLFILGGFTFLCAIFVIVLGYLVWTVHHCFYLSTKTDTTVKSWERLSFLSSKRGSYWRI